MTVALGGLLAMPGVPGPGLLTILLGLMLLDFPGKRRCEELLVRHPLVHGATDRVRRRFGEPPLVLDEEREPSAIGPAGRDDGR